MNIKNEKSSVKRYKKQLILTSKINNTLSFFKNKKFSSKNRPNESLILNKTLFYNKSFSKTTNTFNNTHRNLSYNNINKTYVIEPEKQNTNLLNSIYKNSYFPKSFKNKNFIKEIYNRLPYLHIKTYNTDNNKNEINDNKEIKDILIKEYKNSINNFNVIYKNSGEELFNEIKSKENSNESVISIMKNNVINSEENNYISSIIKSKRKNISVEFENENYISPKNSLMTLKINNQLINNIKESVINYQYNSYAEKINETQQNKLKLLIMPKLNIKLAKFHFDSSNNSQRTQKKEDFRRQSYYKKFNAYKFSNSRNKKEENNKNKQLDDINEDDINIEQKDTIDSVNTRNSLIVTVKSYYCKYLKRNVSTPCSRTEATFTKYKNKLYLFGGSISTGINELWYLEFKGKRFIWKKIEYIKDPNITLNPRYGHSCVYFNNNLYIYGGNINLKKLKNTLEDILIYNIKYNTLKIGTFKAEPISLTKKNLYIPQRRNHIANVIGWNMIVHGGIDINKEYLKHNVIYSPNNGDIRINTENNIKDNESFILNDWMMLDLITLKWSQMSNIIYKLKDKKMMNNAKLKGGIYRVYHSSCLILSYENIMKGNKINIYKNNNNIKYDSKEDESEINAYDFQKEGKYKFDIKYEGIYIFGGLDENLKETNNLFILHCFRNPLIFFEPQIKGIPPEKRCMSSINFDKNLNIITLFGGKDVYKVYNDLFILDIMNFEWIKIKLFGPENICKKMGHCSGILNEQLIIFGGCDENNKYPLAKILNIELNILKNRNISKIYDYANTSIKQSPKDSEGKYILKLLRDGHELPKNFYNYLRFTG